jgi:peptide/nickel transport system permease protein
MARFILRRLGQAVITVLGVMILTFLLFNIVAGDVSASYLRENVPQDLVERWKADRGLDKPLFFRLRDEGQWLSPLERQFWDNQFVHHLGQSVTFRARSYDSDAKPIAEIIKEGAPYSLALTVPALGIGWLVGMVISLAVAYHHGRAIDKIGVFFSVLGMCIPLLAYVIAGQWLVSYVSARINVDLTSGVPPVRNIYIPVIIAVIAGLGANVRFYRTIFLDEMHKDYVRTARAKGASTGRILFVHVLKNGMLPILTQLVLAIPFLIMGSMLLERFFGIPGLGNRLLESIETSNVPIVSSLTFLIAVIYVSAILLTDILYAIFDPRVRLQ